MPNIQIVSRQRHSQVRWQAVENYLAVAQDAVVPLVMAELPKAQATMPLAFVVTGEGDSAQYVPVAVLGLGAGRNLWVAPDGRWLGAYIPAAYRSRPFLLANTEQGQQVLCIEEDIGLPGGDAGAKGEAFFTEAGEPAPAVATMLHFLTEVETSRAATARICAVLQRHNLFQPWPISVQTEAGNQPLSGLFRINEAAFNALPAEALLQIHEAGALALVFCQLLSMQHLPRLGELAQLHAQAAQAAQVAQAEQAARMQVRTTPTGELDLEFLNHGGTLRFGA